MKEKLEYQITKGDFIPDYDSIGKICFMFFWLSITSTWTGLSSVLAFIP